MLIEALIMWGKRMRQVPLRKGVSLEISCLKGRTRGLNLIRWHYYWLSICLGKIILGATASPVEIIKGVRGIGVPALVLISR